ncbi:YukJ family protein [Vallitalea pronyensis]|uniref:YukJ family protein n=1 Tax=Vallitalea pronyensis TaxID=1348613 RepID=A0A8J8MPJ9_9FIRM|nr:YukJ family protein [Vallitalea pronyensis]QUI25206.1 YukJ family protein [Vallitalea pronyensis]
MSLQTYGVLKCKVIATKQERDKKRPHYQVHVRAGQEDYRISVNIKSYDVLSEVLFYTDENFTHEVTQEIKRLPYGFFYSQYCTIDYVRSELGFTRESMKNIPHDRHGPNNDLNEKLNHYVIDAIERDADLYVFGTRWKSNNYCKEDRIFRFQPAMGMHDIHMNQGNVRHWKNDDGIFQDGCLLFHYPSRDHWIGIFLAFQSQSWDTDDCMGHRLKRAKKHIN